MDAPNATFASRIVIPGLLSERQSAGPASDLSSLRLSGCRWGRISVLGTALLPFLFEELHLRVLKILGQGHQHAGGPGEREESGHGDHAFEQAPALVQVVVAAEAGVIQQRKVVAEAAVALAWCRCLLRLSRGRTRPRQTLRVRWTSRIIQLVRMITSRPREKDGVCSNRSFNPPLARTTVSMPNPCMAMVTAISRPPQKISSREVTYCGGAGVFIELFRLWLPS